MVSYQNHRANMYLLNTIDAIAICSTQIFTISVRIPSKIGLVAAPKLFSKIISIYNCRNTVIQCCNRGIHKFLHCQGDIPQTLMGHIDRSGGHIAV